MADLIEKINNIDLNEEESKGKEADLPDEKPEETVDDNGPEECKVSDEEEEYFDEDKFIEGMKDGTYKKILVLSGAGMSVSAGIPDYRSPKTGLYTTLNKKYKLDYPE